MASVATATMAVAAGRPSASTAASSLQTPGSGTFPSEMLSPMANSPSLLKREDSLKTPITPPSAYLDFLKNMTPAMMSPVSSGTSSRFSFNEKTFDKPDRQPSSDPSAPRSTSITPPNSLPALSRNTSYDSNHSDSPNVAERNANLPNAASLQRRASRPDSPRIIIPPSQFAKPPQPRSSARTPRRLNIPHSPYSPALGSAQTAPSPYTMSSTPLSAAPWSASFSPVKDSPADATTPGGPSGKVSVRHVVTRTVTYCRTPLDPAPKGKRRKLEDPSSTSGTSNDISPEPLLPTGPAIKQEKIEELSSSSSPSDATETDTNESASDVDVDVDRDESAAVSSVAATATATT